MAGDGSSAHTTGARVLDVTLALAARNGVMSKRSGAAREVRKVSLELTSARHSKSLSRPFRQARRR
jgi:hypothetical protein